MSPVNFIEEVSSYGWAKEATRGTGVSQTGIIVCDGIDFDDDDTVERPQHLEGVAWQNPGDEFVSARGVKFVVPEFDLVLEQLQCWQGMAIKPVVSAGSAPTTHTSTPAINADPATTARSFERRLTDGVNNVDDKFLYGMLTKWSIKWTERGVIRQSAEGFTRRRKDATITPAALPATITHIPAALMTVFVDDTFGTLGGTQYLSQILEGEWSIETGNMPYSGSDGRTDLDFSSYEFNPKLRVYKLKLICLEQNAGLVPNERTKAEAAAIRAIRLRASISASARFTIDGLYTHVKGTSGVKVGERNGQNIIEFNLIQTTDKTNALSMVTTNSIATDA